MSIAIINQVVEQLQGMPEHLQWQVLQFVRTLVKSEVRGTPGQNLLQFAGLITAQDLKLMGDAIAGDCERVDIDEW